MHGSQEIYCALFHSLHVFSSHICPPHFLCFRCPALLCSIQMDFVWHFRFLAFTWQLFAVSVASLSMLFYVIVQFLYRLLKYASDSWVYIISVKVFSSSRINIRIRCSQILYWPIFLQHNGTR